MKAVFWAGVGTLFPFLMTITGAALVFLLKNQKEDGPCMGFAAGVMRAAGNYINTILTQCGLFASALWRWQSR